MDSSEEVLVRAISELLDLHLKIRTTDVVLISPHAQLSTQLEIALLRLGFSPTVSSRMYSYAVDTSQSLLVLEKGLSKNWRHNLRRARNNDQLSVKWVTDHEERRRALRRLRDMYATLTQRKSFAGAIDMSTDTDWMETDHGFEIVEAALAGEVVAARVVYVANDHVMDFLAASAERAKNIYATYALMWAVIEKAVALQKRFVECGGIDPNGNPGVFNFKKGLGGRPILLGPLWLHTQSRFLRTVVRTWIARSW